MKKDERRPSYKDQDLRPWEYAIVIVLALLLMAISQLAPSPFG